MQDNAENASTATAVGDNGLGTKKEENIEGQLSEGKEESTEEAPELITGVKLWLLMIAMYLGCFLMLLDATVVSTATPKITDEFNSLKDIGWYGSGYQLGCAVMAPLTGKIYQHFSLKWSYLVLFALFEIGSAICGAAQSSAMLIGGRVVSGIGAASLLNGAMTIVSCAAPPAARPALIGSMMAVAQIGNVLGPLIGGAFTSGYTWRWSFYINLPLGAIIAIFVVFIHIPDQIPKKSVWVVLRQIHHYLDLVGFSLFSGSVIMLLMALAYGGNQFRWGSSVVIGLFVGSGATFFVWLAWDWHRGDDGLLPISMIRKQVVWVSTLNYAFLMSAVFGMAYYIPIYFQAVKNSSAVLSGVYMLPTVVAQLIVTLICGKLIMMVGYLPPFAMAGGAFVALGTGLYSTFDINTSTGKWIGYQILSGVGRGCGFQPPFLAVQFNVPLAQLSTALAFVVWAQYIGPTVFLSIFNTMLNTTLAEKIPQYSPDADAPAIILAGATAFRKFVAEKDLRGVLLAYCDAVDRVFYLMAACGVVAFATAWGMGWHDLRKLAAGPPPKSEDETTTPPAEDSR